MSSGASPSRIVEHPWQAIGCAFLLGAWTACELPHLPRNRVARGAFAMIGAIALRAAHEVVLYKLAGAARTRIVDLVER